MTITLFFNIIIGHFNHEYSKIILTDDEDNESVSEASALAYSIISNLLIAPLPSISAVISAVSSLLQSLFKSKFSSDSIYQL